jgi:hypothetical protein
LAGAVAWALLGAAIVSTAFKWRRVDTAIIALVILSHWPLDLIVHHPDLPLLPWGPQRFGLGLWDHPATELFLEIALFIAGGALLVASLRRKAWPWIAYLFTGVAFMFGTRAGQPAPTIRPSIIALSGLSVYVAFAIGAWWVERRSSGGLGRLS